MSSKHSPEPISANFPVLQILLKRDLPAVQENIVIETVKEAEDGNGIIVRAYETWNSKTDVEFTFCDEIKSVTECNLIEDGADAVEFNGKSLVAEFKPFEIKTFRIEF